MKLHLKNFMQTSMLKAFILLLSLSMLVTTPAYAEDNINSCVVEFIHDRIACRVTFYKEVRASRNILDRFQAVKNYKVCVREAIIDYQVCTTSGSVTPEIDYSDDIFILTDEVIEDIVPLQASEETTFTISPTLPAGLTLDAGTGVISGEIIGGDDSETIYTVSASASGGTASDSFILGVSTTSIAAIDLEPSIIGNLTVSGIDEAELNALNPVVTYSGINGLEFVDLLSMATVTVNGQAVTLPSSFTNTEIQFELELEDGLNTVRFSSMDTNGNPIVDTKTVFAGDNTLIVNLVDQNGNAISQDTTVELSLVDDLSLQVVQQTELGSASFENLPSRTVLIEAITSDNRIGVVGGLGDDGSLTITINDLIPPSEIDNNDISLGLAGWETDSTSVFVVPHDETQELDGSETPPPGLSPIGEIGNQASSSSNRSIRDEEMKNRNSFNRIGLGTNTLNGQQNSQQESNQDIRLMTSGEGPQRITRSFTPQPETGKITVRYRFVTSEIPGGFFGSEFNDYFSVAIIASNGTSEVDSGSMNGLGLAAFNQASGATQYRTIEIEIEPNSGVTVNVDATVANVADGLLDSSVEIDFVEEEADIVTPSLTYNSANGGFDLNYEVSTEESTSDDIQIEVFWANGTNESDQTGDAIFTFTVPEGTNAGTFGPERVFGNFLNDAPDNVSHILANAESTIGSIADVSVTYRDGVDGSDVSSALEEIIQDGGRQAGDDDIEISSTQRNAEEQANAMFGINLVRGFTGSNEVTPIIAANIAEQIGVYAAPGDRVIRVYEAQVAGLSEAQILAQSANILAAMVAQINVEGCANVSRHCSDPAVMSVVDIPLSGIVATGRTRFRNAVEPQVARVLDENNVFHVEFNIP